MKREVLITGNEIGEVSAYLNGDLLELVLIEKRPEVSKVVYTKSIEYDAFIPPVNYPWHTYGKKLIYNPISVPMSAEL